MKFYAQLKPYRFPIILISSILLGAFTGNLLGPNAIKLKPLGDIFLNLIFTLVVPLVFFSVSSAIASMSDLKKMWKIINSMMLVFLFCSLIAAIFMLIVVKIFPPGQNTVIHLGLINNTHPENMANQLVTIFTVSDFVKLFSRENMPALIIFSILIGVATTSLGEKGKLFSDFLRGGTDVFVRAINFVMYYAPIGFFAYFAVLVGELGPKLLETYYQVSLTYYLASIFYFIIAYTFYAYLAKKNAGIKLFWKNIFFPATTALATCSSAASIPANLEAAKNMGVPTAIYELVIPLGTVLHKEGSILGGMLKIAFLFGIFHLSFASPIVFVTAILMSVLVGTVMGAIPSGGMVGEMLILSVYGFPPEALIVIAAISILIDPPATLLNVTGNTISSMLVARTSHRRVGKA